MWGGECVCMWGGCLCGGGECVCLWGGECVWCICVGVGEYACVFMPQAFMWRTEDSFWGLLFSYYHMDSGY